MDTNIIDRWTEALRSGDFQQSEYPGTYCALGLLASLQESHPARKRTWRDRVWSLRMKVASKIAGFDVTETE